MTRKRSASSNSGSAYAAVTGEIASIPIAYPQPTACAICFAGALVLLAIFVVSVGVTFRYGIGMWGNNIPGSWGIAISNYIWFLGLGHAGTLISALLLLLKINRPNSLSRFAEAMTLFAVVC